MSILEKELNYFRKQSIMTDPKEHIDLYEHLPDTVPELMEVVQGLIIHGEASKQYDVNFSTNQNNEELLRSVSQMLNRIRKLDSRQLTYNREPAKRLVGMCRDMSVLLASFLRHKQIPARVRAGFAGYFDSKIKYEDHWLCEYWDDKDNRWKLADPQLDDNHRRKFNITFDHTDVKEENGYYLAGRVYKLCRNGEENKDDFGYNKWWKGYKSIRGNMLHDFNCLNLIELMPWDLWADLYTKKEAELKNSDKELFDVIAEMTINVSNNFESIGEIFKELPYDYDHTLASQLKILGIAGEFKRVDMSKLHEEKKDILSKYKDNDKENGDPNTKSEEKSSVDQVLQEAINEKDGFIVVSGAKQNNLKNVSLEIPKDKFVVVTGVSGSGKSTLAFDILYAEGKRRYMEGFSSYLRNQLGLLEKPDVERVTGLNPPIAIEQKTVGKNPRSTVGTMTDIIHYLRSLYARIGKFHCPQCGEVVQPQNATQIRKDIMSLRSGVHVEIIAEHKNADGINRGVLKAFHVPSKDAPDYSDISSSLYTIIQKGLELGKGVISVRIENQDEISYSDKILCPKCDILYTDLNPSNFDYNSHEGSCHECNGLGISLEVDPNLIIKDENLSILDGASEWWGTLRNKKKTGNWMVGELFALAEYFDVDIDCKWKDLPEEYKYAALYGTGDIEHTFEYESNGRVTKIVRPAAGAVTNILRLFRETKSESSKSNYTKFMESKKCPVCEGEKLATEARYVTVDGKRLPEITCLPLADLYQWVVELSQKLNPLELEISKEMLGEIKKRLEYIIDVGLHYLSLDRPAPTLSGGEGQRIRLATQLGCSLVGLLYILDEPSIGLHPRDHQSLLDTIIKLKADGNSVIVVEHDADTMKAADWVIDIGPGAGAHGGKVMATGTPSQIMNNKSSLTGKYLSGELRVTPIGKQRKSPEEWIELQGATLNNLQQVNVKIPLNMLTCVTGVSGSGKSSLITKTLAPAIEKILLRSNAQPGDYEKLIGLEEISNIVNINQDPIGRSPRSTPATYVEVFDKIRKFYADLPASKTRHYKPNQFSFNSKTGQCKSCDGYGKKKIEMHFIADTWVTCTECEGKRFNQETLEIEYKGKTIADVLEMDVLEALEFFHEVPNIRNSLQTLKDVGLDYLKLGQNSTTLSGGEAQRIKLAKELQRANEGSTLYILDEPTTGLHFSDISKLLAVLERLTHAGNTVILIEHNTEVISAADWVIDLGPEGGNEGGTIIAEGTPEEVAKNNRSYTGRFIKEYLEL